MMDHLNQMDTQESISQGDLLQFWTPPTRTGVAAAISQRRTLLLRAVRHGQGELSRNVQRVRNNKGTADLPNLGKQIVKFRLEWTGFTA